MDTQTTSLPKTKKEADQCLRELAPVGSIIEVDEPYTFGARDRLLSFTAITPTGTKHTINSLVARIWDMRFLDIPGKQGEQALHAWDTGNQVGETLVAQLALRLYRRHNAYRYKATLKETMAIEEYKEPELGMRTPDGSIQTIDTIEPGVYWVDTGSHEFLVLSLAHAQRLLSPQAYTIGETCGAWMFFEEDLAVAAPLFEHPEWAAWSGFSATPYHPEEVLHHYFPAYFEVPVQLGLPLHDEQTEP